MASWPLRPALRLAALGGRSLLAANLGLRLLQGSLPLLGLVAMQRLLDAVAKGIDGDPKAATEVWYAVAFASAVALVGAVVAMFGQTVAERHARRCADRCASLVQRHAAALDLEQIESPNVRDLLHRAAGDALSRPVRIVQDLGAFAVAATMLSTMVATVATAALWLPALLALAAVPQVLVRHRHSRLQFAWVEDNTEAQRRVGYLGGLLVGRPWAKDLRMLELAGPVATRVERERQHLTEEQLALAARRARAEALAQGLSTVSMFAAYAYLAFEALAGGLSLGGLLLLAQAAQRTQNGVRDCLLAHAALCDDQRFVQHLFSFLELRPRAVPASAAESAAEPGPRSPLSIAVRNVHYTYPDSGNATLNGLSFEVGAGERVALVGGNGAGKTTLVRLLCGLAQPSEGSIELG
ncbi:MAG: ATP-binding cassette domain-containing protein, partial [Planctomycetota bacterium]